MSKIDLVNYLIPFYHSQSELIYRPPLQNHQKPSFLSRISRSLKDFFFPDVYASDQEDPLIYVATVDAQEMPALVDSFERAEAMTIHTAGQNNGENSNSNAPVKPDNNQLPNNDTVRLQYTGISPEEYTYRVETGNILLFVVVNGEMNDAVTPEDVGGMFTDIADALGQVNGESETGEDASSGDLEVTFFSDASEIQDLVYDILDNIDTTVYIFDVQDSPLLVDSLTLEAGIEPNLDLTLLFDDYGYDDLYVSETGTDSEKSDLVLHSLTDNPNISSAGPPVEEESPYDTVSDPSQTREQEAELSYNCAVYALSSLLDISLVEASQLLYQSGYTAYDTVSGDLETSLYSLAENTGLYGVKISFDSIENLKENAILHIGNHYVMYDAQEGIVIDNGIKISLDEFIVIYGVKDDTLLEAVVGAQDAHLGQMLSEAELQLIWGAEGDGANEDTSEPAEPQTPAEPQGESENAVEDTEPTIPDAAQEEESYPDIPENASQGAEFTPGDNNVTIPGNSDETDPETYVVRPGDTLSEIAAEHGVTLQELLEANPQFGEEGNRDPDLIYPDEEILIPISENTTASGSGKITLAPGTTASTTSTTTGSSVSNEPIAASCESLASSSEDDSQPQDEAQAVAEPSYNVISPSSINSHLTAQDSASITTLTGGTELSAISEGNMIIFEDSLKTGYANGYNRNLSIHGADILEGSVNAAFYVSAQAIAAKIMGDVLPIYSQNLRVGVYPADGTDNTTGIPGGNSFLKDKLHKVQNDAIETFLSLYHKNNAHGLTTQGQSIFSPSLENRTEIQMRRLAANENFMKMNSFASFHLSAMGQSIMLGDVTYMYDSLFSVQKATVNMEAIHTLFGTLLDDKTDFAGVILNPYVQVPQRINYETIEWKISIDINDSYIQQDQWRYQYSGTDPPHRISTACFVLFLLFIHHSFDSRYILPVNNIHIFRQINPIEHFLKGYVFYLYLSIRTIILRCLSLTDKVFRAPDTETGDDNDSVEEIIRQIEHNDFDRQLNDIIRRQEEIFIADSLKDIFLEETTICTSPMPFHQHTVDKKERHTSRSLSLDFPPPSRGQEASSSGSPTEDASHLNSAARARKENSLRPSSGRCDYYRDGSVVCYPGRNTAHTPIPHVFFIILLRRGPP